LVLAMVAYHCASVTPYASLRTVMESLRFLHYAFLFVTGYLVGAHYYPQLRQAPGRVQKRLLVRSAKLFLVFFLTNVVFIPLGFGFRLAELRSICSDLPGMVNNCLLTVRFNANYEILYYLAAFLLLAGLTCRVTGIGPLLVLLLVVQFLKPCGMTRMLVIGMMGALLGITAVSEGRSPLVRAAERYLYVVPVVLLLHIFAPPSAIEKHAAAKILIVVWEIVLWLGTFLLLVRLKLLRVVSERLAFLGTYTLFAYLLQMPVARATYTGLRGVGALSEWGYYACAVILVIIISFAAVAILDKLRIRAPWANGAYRLVFA